MTAGAAAPNWKRYVSPRLLHQRAREEGLIWCLKKFLAYLLLGPLAVALRLTLLALKPVVHIRFGELESPGFGNLASLPELYLCERDAGMHPKKTFDIWFHYDVHAGKLLQHKSARRMVSNEQLLIMWKRVIHINDIARDLDRLNRLLPPGQQDFIANMPQYHWDRYAYYERFDSHLTFTKEEEKRGLAQLKEMGIGPEDPFVCIHVRDSRYLEVARPWNPKVPNNRRPWDYRDSNIQNYALAARTLAELGYFVVRLGKHVQEPFQCDHPRVIDYASKYQSDFMDVFLPSRCAFFIGQNSGGGMLPMVFRRPTVFVNIFPLAEAGHCQYRRGILILKKYYSNRLGRELRFREVFDLGLAQYAVVMPKDIRNNHELDLKIMDNSPEEINEAALEMHRRLSLTYTPEGGAAELQERFLSIVRSYPQEVPLVDEQPRITAGAHFLRTNQNLLD